MLFRKYLAAGMLLFLAGCMATGKLPKNATDAELYQYAITEAMSPNPSKVYSELVPVTQQNPDLSWKNFNVEDNVLVVSWKWSDSIYKPYVDSTFFNTQRWPIWVTTSPQLLKRMQEGNYTDTNKRLLQLLGLPPNAEYNYFVEFWVRPADLFRPCPDPEITDEVCSLCFPDNISASHKDFINSNRVSRYYPCELYNKYPWTQLGYTYDWNPANTKHIGLSEFVIGTNTDIKVKATYTTWEYLQKR